MFRFAFAVIVLSAPNMVLGQDRATALGQCISADGHMLGSVDIPDGGGGIVSDGACRMVYDKRPVEGSTCIWPAADPRAKACDTKLIAVPKPIGVLTCESEGEPLGSLEITTLGKDLTPCAPCMLQVGNVIAQGRTVFYPYNGDAPSVCGRQ